MRKLDKDFNNPQKMNAFKGNKDINFKGHTIKEGADGKKYHQFYLPQGTPGTELEVVTVGKDGKPQSVKSFKSGIADSKGLNFWTMPCEEDQRVLYRFKNSNGKYFTDLARSVTIKTGDTDSTYNVAISSSKAGLNAAKQMIHVVPSTVAVAEGKKDIRSNHFYNYGGKISDMIKRLPQFEELGVKRILSTPVFGDDQISAHGYWTTNPYVVTKSRGSVNDFNKLQVELYKKGMGFIADGAFVNEGLEGIHLSDVIKYGKESPYFNWFETHGFTDNGGIKMGVLPMDEKAYNNVDYHIINSPTILEEGASKAVKNPKYDPQKPTFIQVFDKRFVTDDQLNQLKEHNQPLRDYKNADAIEKANLKAYVDGTQPICVELKPKEVEQKMKQLAKNPIAGDIREEFFHWDNVSFVKSDKSGGVTLWDGNKDIAKLMFVRPSTKINELEKQFGKEPINSAKWQVQDYIVQVGQYWTDKVDKTLTEHTANAIATQLQGAERTPENVMKAIETLSNGKDAKLPPQITEMIKKGEISKELIANVFSNKYHNLPEAKAPVSVLDAVMNVPLDSIDFPRELNSLLSSPQVKKLANDEKFVGCSRHEFMQVGGESYKKMSDNYKKMDALYKDVIAPKVVNIIKKNPVLSAKFLNEKGALRPESAQEFRLIAEDMTKAVMMKSIANANLAFDNEGKLVIDADLLAEQTHKNMLYKGGDTHEEAVGNLIKSIKEGMKNVGGADEAVIGKNMELRVKNLDSNLVKISKLLLHKTESGLNWRIDAAKDIADIDEMRRITAMSKDGMSVEKEAFFKETTDEINKFWTKFHQGVEDYNKKSYGILEFTDFTQFEDNWGKTIEIESKILDNTGFTTQTNYNFLYSSPQKLVHDCGELTGPGHMGEVVDSFQSLENSLIGEVDKKTKAVGPSHLRNSTHENAAFSHMATGNHDKPRVLSTFSVDSSIFVEHEDTAVKKAMMEAVTGKEIPRPSKSDTSSAKKFQEIQELFDKCYSKKSPEWWATENKFNFALNNYKQDWAINDMKAVGLEEEAKKLAKLRDEFSSSQIDVEYKQLLNKSIEDSLKDPLHKRIAEAIDNVIDVEGGKFFARRDFDHNWAQVAKEADLSPEDLKKLGDVRAKYLAPALEKYKSMMEMMVCMPGNPTIYAGDDLGMLGVESSCKNIYVQNRNPLQWLRVEGDQADSVIGKFRNKVADTFSLRNKPELSPLVNGHTVVLDIPHEVDIPGTKDKAKTQLFGMFRYNDERDVITILNRKGFDNTRVIGDRTNSIDKIKMVSDDARKGVKGGLQPGIRYFDATDKEKKIAYKIDEAFNLVREDGKHIELSNSALILEREESYFETFAKGLKSEQKALLKKIGINSTDNKAIGEALQQKANIGAESMDGAAKDVLEKVGLFKSLKEMKEGMSESADLFAKKAIEEHLHDMANDIKKVAQEAASAPTQTTNKIKNFLGSGPVKLTGGIVAAMGLAAAGAIIYNKNKDKVDLNNKPIQKS